MFPLHTCRLWACLSRLSMLDRCAVRSPVLGFIFCLIYYDCTLYVSQNDSVTNTFTMLIVLKSTIEVPLIEGETRPMISEYRFGQVETPVGYGSISFAVILLQMQLLFSMLPFPLSCSPFVAKLSALTAVGAPHYHFMIGERLPLNYLNSTKQTCIDSSIVLLVHGNEIGRSHSRLHTAATATSTWTSPRQY